MHLQCIKALAFDLTRVKFLLHGVDSACDLGTGCPAFNTRMNFTLVRSAVGKCSHRVCVSVSSFCNVVSVIHSYVIIIIKKVIKS